MIWVKKANQVLESRWEKTVVTVRKETTKMPPSNDWSTPARANEMPPHLRFERKCMNEVRVKYNGPNKGPAVFHIYVPFLRKDPEAPLKCTGGQQTG